MDIDFSFVMKEPDDWAEECKINVDDLDQELSDQASRYVYYASLAAYATHIYEEARAELLFLEAQRNQEIRNSYRDKDERVTEKMIETEIQLDPTVQAKRKEIREKKLQRDLCRAATNGFEQRLQMLIALEDLEWGSPFEEGLSEGPGSQSGDPQTGV